jgi:hypothetical protein
MESHNEAGSKLKVINERATMFRITTNAMINVRLLPQWKNEILKSAFIPENFKGGPVAPLTIKQGFILRN